MKPQKLTKALLMPNACFWRARADTDPDTGKVTVRIEEWRIQAIQNMRPEGSTETVPTAKLALKVDGKTWVKLSTRTGDYGWSKGISKYEKATCHLGQPLPNGLATTKHQACELAMTDRIADHERLVALSAKFGHPCPIEDPEYMAEYDQERAALTRAIAYWKGRAKTN